MEVERMVELLEVRLLELGASGVQDVAATVERELAYALAFCALEKADDELGKIVVELAAADVLGRGVATDGAVKSMSMGDVSVGYELSAAAAQRAMAEDIYRRAIARLAAKRGIKW